MIVLPPGFDYVTFIDSLLACIIPFVPIMMLIVAYKLLKKAIRGL